MSEQLAGTSDQPYSAAWRDYRRRRTAVAAVVIGMVGLTCFGLDPSRETRSGVTFWVIAWGLLISVIVWWLTWRCPRCGRYFSAFPQRIGRYGHNRCDHCGLPKWSVRDPDSGVSSSPG